MSTRLGERRILPKVEHALSGVKIEQHRQKRADQLDQFFRTLLQVFNKKISLLSTLTSFFSRIDALHETVDINRGIGTPHWPIIICLFITWIGIYIVSSNGIHSTGKASYFLAIVPYIILFALLIRAATLDGAREGIIFFVKPVWRKLLTPQVNKTFYVLFVLKKKSKSGLVRRHHSMFLLVEHRIRLSHHVRVLQPFRTQNSQVNQSNRVILAPNLPAGGDLSLITNGEA